MQVTNPSKRLMDSIKRLFGFETAVQDEFVVPSETDARMVSLCATVLPVSYLLL